MFKAPLLIVAALPLLLLACLFYLMPVLAQDGDKPAAEPMQISVEFEVVEMGTRAKGAEVELIVLAQAADGELSRVQGTTDDQGKLTLTLPTFTEARVYSAHPWIVPEVHRRIDPDQIKPDTALTVQIRSLRKVRLSGVVKREDGSLQEGVEVSMAPLDQLPEGGYGVFEKPVGDETDSEGEFSKLVGTGYYAVWAQWSDRKTQDWDGYFGIKRVVEVFQDTTIELTISRAPTFTGKLIDGRTGEPERGIVDLISNPYLASRNNYCGNGERDPLGMFEAEFRSLDAESFDMILRGRDSSSSVRVLTGYSLARLEKEKSVVIRPEGGPHITVALKTKKLGIPLDGKVVRVKPTGGVDVPPHLRAYLTLDATTDRTGSMDLWGLPKGRYSFYLGSTRQDNDEAVIGERELSGGVESIELELDLSFATGKLTYPDGTACTHATALVDVSFPEGGGSSSPAIIALYRNAHSMMQGKFFLPFRWHDATYTIRIIAPAKGKPDGEIELITDPVEFTPGEQRVLERDFVLKPMPVPAEEEKEDGAGDGDGEAEKEEGSPDEDSE